MLCGFKANSWTLFNVRGRLRIEIHIMFAVKIRQDMLSINRDYKKSDNLHMGVVSSSGVVYEFDVDGLRCDRSSSWTHCLPIKDFSPSADPASWSEFWDFTLNVISCQEAWKRTM